MTALEQAIEQAVERAFVEARFAKEHPAARKIRLARQYALERAEAKARHMRAVCEDRAAQINQRPAPRPVRTIGTRSTRPEGGPRL